MLELFQKILKDKLTPNQLLLLYGIKNKITFPIKYKQDDASELIGLGLIIYKEGPMYSLTEKGKRICAKYTNYFNVAKKRTAKQLLGKDYVEMLKMYREAFPAGKLPSGKPGRQNVKTLENAFRWFFETYDYTWQEVVHATVLYIREYEQKDYMYMKTSQYFICKSDKNKVKHSELADYCDMIRDGVTLEDKQHFKEKVV
jgi:predicted transcriptional regulator